MQQEIPEELSKLYDRLRFNDDRQPILNFEELKLICFYLQIDWDNIAGETKDTKLLEFLRVHLPT